MLAASIRRSIVDGCWTRREVLIRWPDGQVSRVTEGQARGLFTSRLADTENLSVVKRGRWDCLGDWESFRRAVIYYRALCLLWLRGVGVFVVGWIFTALMSLVWGRMS